MPDVTPGGALAIQLLAEAREDLAKADQKASTLFAVFGIVAGALLTAILAGDWSPHDLAAGAETVWWIGAALVAVALVLLGAAVWPRIGNPSTDVRVTYFGHVRRLPDVGTLRTTLEHQAACPADRTLDQLRVVSNAVWTKYQLIRGALGAFAVAVVLLAVAALAG